jgi:hypothetical protein
MKRKSPSKRTLDELIGQNINRKAEIRFDLFLSGSINYDYDKNSLQRIKIGYLALIHRHKWMVRIKRYLNWRNNGLKNV